MAAGWFVVVEDGGKSPRNRPREGNLGRAGLEAMPGFPSLEAACQGVQGEDDFCPLLVLIQHAPSITRVLIGLSPLSWCHGTWLRCLVRLWRRFTFSQCVPEHLWEVKWCSGSKRPLFSPQQMGSARCCKGWAVLTAPACPHWSGAWCCSRAGSMRRQLQHSAVKRVNTLALPQLPALPGTLNSCLGFA